LFLYGTVSGFQKAFDSVPHELLLRKIYAYGFRGKLFNWIQGFLKGRKQRVSVNGPFSGWNKALNGILQGTVMGPLFFIIYINDFSLLMKNKVLLFADDTKIYYLFVKTIVFDVVISFVKQMECG